MAGIVGDIIRNVQGLQGIASMKMQMDENKAAQERQKIGMDALNKYRESAQLGNPDDNAFTTAVMNVPDAAKNVLASIGIKDTMQKKDAASFALKAANIVESPDQFVGAIDARIKYLQDAGRDPKDSIALREQYLAGDKEGVKRNLKGVAAALVGEGTLAPKIYESTFGEPDKMSEYQRQQIDLQNRELNLRGQQLAQQAKGPDSYFTFGQTAGGIVRQNARTGQVELATDAQGNPIIGAAADPTLQGKITESEKTGALNAERFSDTKKAIKMNDQILEYSKTAEKLLPVATGSGVGAAVDAAGRLVGVSSKSSEAAAKLRTLSGWLVSNVPRMEGPQSNVDVQNYQKMAGDIGNERLPIAERQAALTALVGLIKTQKDLNSQVISGKIQSVYTPGQQPQEQAPAAQRYKVTVKGQQ